MSFRLIERKGVPGHCDWRVTLHDTFDAARKAATATADFIIEDRLGTPLDYRVSYTNKSGSRQTLAAFCLPIPTGSPVLA
jgi:hypothetical protein